ncbi:NAD(P)-dependent oxidoreductase [Candidatus Harpocratesius sp.]
MKIVISDPLGISNELLYSKLSTLRNQGHDIIIYENRVQSDDELVNRCKDAEIIVITNTKFPRSVIEKLSKLKFISVAFTGIDHIDLDTCREKNIAVSNAAGYSTQSVAELTVGLMITCNRKIISCDKATREEKTRVGLIGNELSQKTIGIIGTGAIGIRVTELLQPFQCTILGYNRSEKSEFKKLGGNYTDLQSLMKKSDIISIHLPLTEETRNLIDDNLLRLMKRSAYLVNCARGPIVDYDFLAQLLNANQIAGAAVDVYESEPPLDPSLSILNAKNVIALPHIAFATFEAFSKRADIVISNIENWIKGSQKNKIL